jgi:nucleoside-diphosphate-sugar epimerase
MNVLVTGATGAVGPRIVSALMEAGYAVRTLSVDAPPKGVWPVGVDVRLGDVTDMTTVQNALRDVEAVVHLAALLHIVNPPTELCENYERINIGGTATVVDSAVKAGVKRVILAVYGASDGKILDEDSNTYPSTFYAKTKLAAEKIVLNARRTDGQPIGTVLRFGAVYGSRIKGNYQRLVKALARGRFLALGEGSNRRTLIYDKDLAIAVVLSVSHPEAAGQIFNVTDGRFHTLKKIIGAMSLALGRKPPRLSLPIGPLRFAASILENGTRLLGLKSPIVRATIDKYTEDIAVDGRRIQDILGYTPQYDLATGWAETIQEMRQLGDL